MTPKIHCIENEEKWVRLWFLSEATTTRPYLSLTTQIYHCVALLLNGFLLEAYIEWYPCRQHLIQAINKITVVKKILVGHMERNGKPIKLPARSFVPPKRALTGSAIKNKQKQQKLPLLLCLEARFITWASPEALGTWKLNPQSLNSIVQWCLETPKHLMTLWLS